MPVALKVLGADCGYLRRPRDHDHLIPLMQAGLERSLQLNQQVSQHSQRTRIGRRRCLAQRL
jgi:hypothetical protein